IFYRPARADIATPAFIERVCGYTSGFAHSKTDHETGRSTGESEQRVPLMPAHESTNMDPGEVIILVNGLCPFREKRLDRYEFPELTERGNIPAPPVYDLPDVERSGTSDTGKTHLPIATRSDQHDQGKEH